MKKQITLIFASFIFLLNVTSNAQENTAFEKGSIVITGGYGFPDLYRSTLRLAYNSYSNRTVKGFGPLIIKGDYGIVKFKWGHSVGAGIVIGYNSTNINFAYTDSRWYSGSGWNNYTYSETDIYKTVTIGARGTYHFYTKEKFDCYASIGLGFNINTYAQSTNDPNGVVKTAYTGRSGIYEAFTVGIRYYFTKNIGVYSEVGWDMSAPIQAGIAIKF